MVQGPWDEDSMWVPDLQDGECAVMENGDCGCGCSDRNNHWCGKANCLDVHATFWQKDWDNR